MAIRQPSRSKERADEIADLISAAGEKLVELSIQWFQLNDEQGLSHARRMLNAKEVTLMLSAHLEGGMAHISLNLLRTEIPMPRPFFEIQTPMLPWTLDSSDIPFGAEKLKSDGGSIWPESRNGRTR
ncbi:MAG TPA: hypothetical protein VGL25_08785 [Casimicrobiaceae bacterium]